MRKLILRFIINAAAVGLAAEILPGLSYSGGINGLIAIAIAVSLVNIFVKPVVMLLALPVEIATLGLFTIVINALMLYLVRSLVPAFQLSSFWFPGYMNGPLILAPIQIPVWGTALIGSVIIGSVNATLVWLTK